tara:strand:+ start:87 stop:953 length:867 start_codon:yes stop_codon:yes gene_type:complete
MTFIGKILVVVQVVLSLLFMAFAGAVFTVEQNWKLKFNDVSEELAVSKKDYETQFNKFNNYKTEKKQELDNLDTLSKKRLADFDREKNRAENLQSQLNDLKTQHDLQRTVAQLTGDEAKFRRDEAIEQRQVNKALHEKQLLLVRENRNLEDINFDLTLQIGQREQRHLVLLDELKTARIQARRKGGGLGALPSEDIAPPPPLDGKVVSSRYGIGNRILYVEVSIGGDDGIKEGQLLTVYRPANNSGQKTKYLGQVRIIQVFADKAVGTVREKAKNGVISKGDNVTSKL